jgi:hypothetical protein
MSKKLTKQISCSELLTEKLKSSDNCYGSAVLVKRWTCQFEDSPRTLPACNRFPAHEERLQW